jgi:hypothetical protein
MIQCVTVRAIAIAVAVTCVAAPAIGAEPAGIVAIYWEPPGDPPPGASARAAFAEAVRPLGARLVDARAPKPPALPSLVPSLEAARAAYARFAFADAIAKLDELERQASARGGGDLDARQLSEIYLYRWLCRSELGNADSAWDDLVRAARLDPARIVDPALLPPRAVTAYKRAVGEVAQLPRTMWELQVPADTTVRVDGVTVAGTLSLAPGSHFVAVAAEGYEPWAGLVGVAGARDRFVPPLRPYRLPDGDRLLALASGAPGGAAEKRAAHRLLVGAVERSGAGWQFVARDIKLPDGRFVSESVTLSHEAPVSTTVEALVRRLVATPVASPVPLHRRWWVWTAVGGAAAAVVVGLTVGIVLGTSSPQIAVSGSTK